MYDIETMRSMNEDYYLNCHTISDMVGCYVDKKGHIRKFKVKRKNEAEAKRRKDEH